MEKFLQEKLDCQWKIQNWCYLVEYMVVGRINMNKLNVIYEDNHIIVVEKQPNIPSQADKTEDIDMITIIKEYINNCMFDK